MSRLKNETINGAKWAVIKKMTLQPVQFVFGMLLSRLVSPEEIGILGLTGLFFAIAESLKATGIGAALIRKQDRTEADINTVFWYNLGANFVVATVFWFASPWIADYFNQPALVWLTRVSAGMMLVGALSSIHMTLYSAKRDFRTPAIITLVTTLAAMPVTLYLAYIGWSYWAVMMQGIVSALLNLIILWIVSPWKPKFMFSWASFREFFHFGYKLALSGVIYRIYLEISKFVIGKCYSPMQLALYSRADHLCQMPTVLIQAPLDGIIYPILATIQDDTARLDRVYRQYMRLCLCPNLWLMLTIAVNAESLVYLLYGKMWVPCVPYLQVLCYGYAFVTVIRVNHHYLMVKGRTDLLLRREIILRTFGVASMLVGAYFSVIGVCIAFVVSNVLNLLLTVTYTLRVSDMTVREQISDFYPYLLMVAAANVPSVLLALTPLPYYVCAFAGPLTALAIYLLLLHITKNDAYCMLLNTLVKSERWCKLCRRFPLLSKIGC